MKHEGGRHRIAGLDGARGMAASAVVASHYAMPGTPLGRISVAAFFMLSGYFIVGQLHRHRLSVEAGGIQPLAAFAAFWLTRALRLLPVYLIVLAIAYAVERHYGYVYLRESWEWYLFSIQNLYVGFLQPFWLSYSHTWALAVQNQFYVVLSLALVFVVPAARHIGFLEVVLFACIAIDGSLVWTGVDHQLTRLMPQWGGVFMAMGGILALRGATVAGPQGRNAALMSMIALVVLVVRPNNYHIVEGVFGLIALVFFLYYPMSYVLANPSSAWVRLLETPLARHVGAVSYELYLVHVPVAIFGAKAINGLVERLGVSDHYMGKVVQFSTIYLVSLLIATILHFGVQASLDAQRPRLLDLIRRFSATARDAGTARAMPVPEGGRG